MFVIFLLLTIESIGGSDVLSGTTSFALKLSDALPTEDRNFVFSPLSVHTILSLLYQGASGRTAERLSKTLSLPDSSSTATEYKNILNQLDTNENITIQTANKVYIASPLSLKAGFQAVAKNFFSAEVENIDFSKSAESAAAINGWVRQKTRGKIDNLVSSNDIDGDTRSVLINAIYFKGLWDAEFPKENTKRSKFHVSATEAIDCATMLRKGSYLYDDDKELDARLIRIPYKNEHFSLVIGLPNKIVGADELSSILTSIGNTSYLNNLYKKELNLYLPKFKIESKINLKYPLRAIGLRNIFSIFAQFPNIVDDSVRLHVCKVVQKAFIEVNEEGSVATAATNMKMVFNSMEPQIEDFKIDHPFVYSIIARVDGADVILFAGKVVSPSYNN